MTGQLLPSAEGFGQGLFQSVKKEEEKVQTTLYPCLVPGWLVWCPGNANIHRERRSWQAPTDSDTEERGLLRENVNN